ncbi:RimK/LysX family protein [Candidatus Saccharibacteria bacterium]|nr:RimK/LysX family protein [Candidatus Saccharibacteria bacterium]
MTPPKTTIGRAERINFPTLGIKGVPAKVDTGADSSTIWCSKIRLYKGELRCVLFDDTSPFYTGETLKFQKKDVDLTRVANSFGHKEVRYKVQIPVEIKGRTIKGSFTLTNRSSKLYPILIGRSTLHRKFLVDVSKGSPLKEEVARYHRLKTEMSEIKKGLNL